MTQSGVALCLPPHSKSWRKIWFGHHKRLRLEMWWLRHRFHPPKILAYDAGLRIPTRLNHSGVWERNRLGCRLTRLASNIWITMGAAP